MWKRGSRTSALDRAQALLSAKRNSRGDGHTVAVGGSAPPNIQTVLSDVSDLSSVSSAPKYEADTVRSIAPEKSQGRQGGSTKDVRPQSSLGGGGSRFLKRAPPPAPTSSQSPVRGNQMQQNPEPGYVSSSRLGSQTAAKSRLDQIEMRIRSRQQALEQARRGSSPQPEAVLKSLEASLPVSSQSSSDQSPKGKRFLKNKAAVTVDSPNTAPSGSPKGPDVGVTSRLRDVGHIVPPAALERKTLRVVSGVSLESDEEDMRKLLGDSLDSTDDSLLRPERPSSKRTADKMFSKSSQKVQTTPTPSPAAACPSSPSHTASPHSLASASHRGSPFRFTGQAQAHFSPSVLSPPPSPSRVSPSPQRRLNSPHRAASPQRSLSSMSGRSEVHSLEELFPAGPHSEDPHSEMSFASSEDFKINVMTLDDLIPTALGFAEETQRKEREVKHSGPVPGASNRHQQPPRPSGEVKEEEQQQEEDVLDYQSDFESENRTGPDYSASQVSEHLQGDGDEVEEVSEALHSGVSCQRTEDDYSSSFSDTTSRTSDGSQTSQSFSRGKDSRSLESGSSRTLCRQPKRRDSTRKVLKEAGVQTQADTMTHTWTTGMATCGLPLGMTYINPIPVGAEKVEALSSFNPAVFVLNEMLKQQLDMTKQFIERNRHLHSSLVQSLEPPNYRYTTLEDTKEYIRKHRSPKLTVEEALEEVLQEMRQPLTDS